MAHRADGAVPFGRARDVQRAGALLPRPGRTDSCGLIVGDPGIGKTTLARALAAQAEADGARVGWGVAGEWEGAFPLWPWFEAVTELDPQQDVLPSGVEPGSNGIAPVELMRSVALWLAGLASAGPPVLIVLEDLHLADPTAVDLFAYLSRRPLPETVSVIGTARSGRDALDALTCRRIALSGLDEGAVAAMVSAAGRRLDPQALRSLVQRTGGNPLFVQRLLDSGLGDGVGDQPMPNDIAQLLRLQLDSAPPAARPLLDALSVLGSAGIDVLERMTDVLDARAVLVQTPSPLVVVDGDQVHFPHGLVRELLYDELLADDRFQLHARAADTLRDDAGPITVAHHLARAAATHRTFAAAEAAREAARIVRGMGALTEAVDHHRLAVSILRDLDAPAPLADATIDLAVSTAELGRVSDAEQLLNDVIDQERDCPLDASIRRRLVREYGRLRWREEPNPSALDPNRLSRVARQWFAESSDPLDQAVVHTALVQVGEIRGIEPPDLVHGLRAVDAAEHVDDPTVVAEAHLAFRRALMVHHDRLEDRRSMSETGLRLARETRDGELIARARRLALTDALALGDRERALMLLPTEAPSASAREYAALTMAGMAALEGRYEDADTVLDEAMKELDYLGLPAPTLSFVRIVHSWDLGQLESALAEFEPLLPAIADPTLRAAVSLAKALDGQRSVAATLVEEAFAGLTTGTPSPLWTVSMALVAETAAAIDHPLVGELYDQLAPHAQSCALPAMAPVPWVGAIARPLGLLALRLGRIEEAIDHLDTSLVIHQRMRAEPWSARSHAALAVALDAAGDRAAAERHRRTAHEIADRVGMDSSVLVVGDLVVGRTDSPVAPPLVGVARPARFTREGDAWRVGLGDMTAMVKASTGMEYLAILLAHPGSDWHVLDLYTSVAGAPTIIEGSAGPRLDETARRQYQARHAELVTALERATADADIGTMELHRSELDTLEEELLVAFGLGGRARHLADPTERARVNVRRAITRALDRVDEHAPALAEHLRRSVETGRFCRYSPDPLLPLDWA